MELNTKAFTKLWKKRYRTVVPCPFPLCRLMELSLSLPAFFAATDLPIPDPHKLQGHQGSGGSSPQSSPLADERFRAGPHGVVVLTPGARNDRCCRSR